MCKDPNIVRHPYVFISAQKAGHNRSREKARQKKDNLDKYFIAKTIIRSDPIPTLGDPNLIKKEDKHKIKNRKRKLKQEYKQENENPLKKRRIEKKLDNKTFKAEIKHESKKIKKEIKSERKFKRSTNTNIQVLGRLHANKNNNANRNNDQVRPPLISNTTNNNLSHPFNQRIANMMHDNHENFFQNNPYFSNIYPPIMPIPNNLNNNLAVLNQASLLQPNTMFNIPNSSNIEENIGFHFNANNNNNNNNNNNPNNTYYLGSGF